MKFEAVQFTYDTGLVVGRREFKTEKGAMHAALAWRKMFPLAPIHVVGRPDNHVEKGFVREIPPTDPA